MLVSKSVENNSWTTTLFFIAFFLIEIMLICERIFHGTYLSNAHFMHVRHEAQTRFVLNSSRMFNIQKK